MREILVHHVYGQLTATSPNSKFDVKSNMFSLSSLGYPRLVILFSDGGNASLRPLTWQQNWTTVHDPNWENNAGGCGFRFEQTWQQIQMCHPGTYITNVYITTDPGVNVTFSIDNLTVDGTTFSSASDDGNGDNTRRLHPRPLAVPHSPFDRLTRAAGARAATTRPRSA